MILYFHLKFSFGQEWIRKEKYITGNKYTDFGVYLIKTAELAKHVLPVKHTLYIRSGPR